MRVIHYDAEMHARVFSDPAGVTPIAALLVGMPKYFPAGALALNQC
jgi:hypothetical protein